MTCLEELLQEKPGKKQEHGENEQNMLGTETDSDDDSDESNCDKDEPYEVETDETVSSQDEDDFVDDIR